FEYYVHDFARILFDLNHSSSTPLVRPRPDARRRPAPPAPRVGPGGLDAAPTHPPPPPGFRWFPGSRSENPERVRPRVSRRPSATHSAPGPAENRGHRPNARPTR